MSTTAIANVCLDKTKGRVKVVLVLRTIQGFGLVIPKVSVYGFVSTLQIWLLPFM